MLAEFEPDWFEEPVQYNLLDSYAHRKRQSGIPIPGGEHKFTRWGVKALLGHDAMDIYQFEPIWAGGLSELSKISAQISALVTAHDATLSCSQPGLVVPDLSLV